MTPLQQNASLVVQRLDRASDIASSAGLPYKCLVFTTGGNPLQMIDANGVVRTVATGSSTGVVTATVTDAVVNASSVALIVDHTTSAGVPVSGIGVGVEFRADTGATDLAGGRLAMTYSDVTGGLEDAAFGFTLRVGGTLTDVLSLSSPTAGATTLTAAGSATASLNLVGAGGVVITPPAAASGVQTALTVNAANNGAVTAVTEQIDVEFDLNRIVKWAAGAGTLALQRAFSVAAPTYDSVNGAVLTITRAATFYVSGAPSGGADIVLNNSYAILVDSGTVHFDDQLSLGGNVSLSGGAPTITATTADQGITLIPSGIGAVALQGSGGANIVAVDTTGGVSRLGFFNVTPLIRQTVNDCVVAADGTSAGTQLNALLARLRLFGLLT